MTFREVALDYLAWLGDVRDAKPSTLRAVRSDLAEPGIAYRRGAGTTQGRIMKALGDRPAREITTREINALLRTISATGAAPRTVTRHVRSSARSSTTACARARGVWRTTPRPGRTDGASRTPGATRSSAPGPARQRPSAPPTPATDLAGARLSSRRHRRDVRGRPGTRRIQGAEDGLEIHAGA